METWMALSGVAAVSLWLATRFAPPPHGAARTVRSDEHRRRR